MPGETAMLSSCALATTGSRPILGRVGALSIDDQTWQARPALRRWAHPVIARRLEIVAQSAVSATPSGHRRPLRPRAARLAGPPWPTSGSPVAQYRSAGPQP